jgi:cellulose synthase/poly-beta-1,6-N-acetylglucosamine synthase-like glycosyltransferase
VTFAVGSGETAPFVGHNSFLRWEAVQSVGRTNQDGEAADYIAYWSESHVSEDFDMALRLQIAGNIVRLATYHDNEFKEGVSLTIYDELARWEKYVLPPLRHFLISRMLTLCLKICLWLQRTRLQPNSYMAMEEPNHPSLSYLFVLGYATLFQNHNHWLYFLMYVSLTPL